MNKPFDPTKPVQTRSGQPARIICCDAKSYKTFRIIALVKEAEGNEIILTYNMDGKYHLNEEKNVDLVNIPDSRWINVYKFNSHAEPHFGPVWHTKEDAIWASKASPNDPEPVPQYLATIEIPWN